MNIISNYTNIGDDVVYSSFECILNTNTILRFEIKGKKCKVTMEDKVSGIVDISAEVDSASIKSLIRTLRTISSQLDKTKEDQGGIV